MPLKLPKSKQFNRKVTHTRCNTQEKERAKKLGGRRVKGSGCGVEKGDVRVEGILRLECKNTTKKSFSITQEMIEKIENAAIASGEVPAIEVEFVNEKGKLLHKVAVVPSYVLEAIVSHDR